MEENIYIYFLLKKKKNGKLSCPTLYGRILTNINSNFYKKVNSLVQRSYIFHAKDIRMFAAEEMETTRSNKLPSQKKKKYTLIFDPINQVWENPFPWYIFSFP